MLTELRISNFVLIDEVHLHFDEGLTVFTGETGAGKSLLIKALKLLLGDKATPQFIRPTRESAEIEALFYVGEAFIEKLRAKGYPADEEIHIKRIISPQRQRCYLNGSPITLSELTTLTKDLLSLTSQHEHYSFFHKENQLRLIDDFLGLTPSVEEYQKLYLRFKELERELEELRERVTQAKLKRDYLLFQLQEIEDLNPDPEEEQNLLLLRDKLKNLTFLRDSLKALEGLFEATLDQLSQSMAILQKVIPFEPKFASRFESVQGCYYELREFLREIGSLSGSLPEDERGLEEVEARLAKYEKIKKKYRCDTEGLLKLRESLKRELSLSEDSEVELERYLQEKAALEEELLKRAQKISEERQRGLEKIKSRLREELKALALERADFEIELKRREALSSNLRLTGLDEVEFLFSPNPGLPPRPLEKIASGGELSRLFLAFKSLERAFNPVETLIFDEVDTGIGGITALKVGEKLKELAKNNQVLCITHLPQIAKFADHHFVVEKLIGEKETLTRIRKLSEEERALELARMRGEDNLIPL